MFIQSLISEHFKVEIENSFNDLLIIEMKCQILYYVTCWMKL
jgi:hypothetical protein